MMPSIVVNDVGIDSAESRRIALDDYLDGIQVRPEQLGLLISMNQTRQREAKSGLGFGDIPGSPDCVGLGRCRGRPGPGDGL